jgi:hypothetical protein
VRRGATPADTRILLRSPRRPHRHRPPGRRQARRRHPHHRPALAYLELADEFLGTATPDNFPLGASSLLDDLLAAGARGAV